MTTIQDSFSLSFGPAHLLCTLKSFTKSAVIMCSTIQFNFALDEGQLTVLLEADFEHDSREICYIVKNFRLPGHTQTDILPEIRIKKVDGRWVHRDSGWQTALSQAAGQAIDKIQTSPEGPDSPPSNTSKTHP
jgi:hypothetical protein